MSIRSLLGKFTVNSDGDVSADADGDDDVDINTGSSANGEEYVVDAIGEVREAGLVTKIEIPAPEEEAKEKDYVAGPGLLEKVEKAINKESDPILPLGYDPSGEELEVTGIHLSDAFEHVLIAGSTGSSKSTLARAIMVVLAYSGIGFLATFPKGKEDANDLLSALPESRMPDVRIIDPTATDFTTPMNLLDLPEFDDPNKKDDEVRKRVAVSQAVLMQDYGDGYINVETIIEVVSRAMMYSDKSYSFVDMFLLLRSEQRREAFIEEINDPLVADAMKEIAEMDDDQIRPVMKRLMSWTLDPTIRRMISHREASLDWREVIDNDEIVILKLGISSKSAKQQVMLTAWRQLTAAIQERYNETGVQYPYAAFLDEFNDIASEKLNLQDNFARARSMGLALFVMCQYPSQLPDKGRDSVLKAATSNTKNTVALTMEEEEDAKVMASKLRGVEADDIVYLPNFQCWTDVPIGDGERSDGLRLQTIPPMPPLRTEEERDEMVAEIMEETGVEPPTLREILEESPFELEVGELLDVGEDNETVEIDESIRKILCKSVYDQALRETDDGNEWVELVEAAGRMERYLPDAVATDNETKLWNGLIAQVGEEYLERENRDDGVYLRCTDTGYRDFITPDHDPTDEDDEINNNQGGAAHNLMIEQAYDDVTRSGLVMSGVLGQTGDAMADAVATLDDVEVLDVGGPALGVGRRRTGSRKQWEQFEQRYDLIDRLTHGQDLAIESEKSTHETKFAQTLVNLAAAVNAGHRCLFLCQTEEEAAKIWRRLAESPRCLRDDYPKPGQHRLYQLSKPLTIGDKVMYRPAEADETVFVYDERQEVYRLLDSDGNEHAVFDSAEEIHKNPEKYPAVEGQIDDYEKYVRVTYPFAPEYEFDDGIPGTDMWDAAPLEDGLAIYDGEADESVPVEQLLEYESDDGTADPDLDLDLDLE